MIKDDGGPEVGLRRPPSVGPSPGRGNGWPDRGWGAPRHHAAAARRSWWHLLLCLCVVVPLLIPVYNRIEPKLWGIPFFYWFQTALIPVEITLITLFYQATKRRR